MKKVYYCHVVPVNENAYLYYNSFEDCFLILNSQKHNLYQRCAPEEIETLDEEFYALLVKNGFIENDEIDETAIVEYKKLTKKLDMRQYNVVLNTTLDCNLACWYCYESKIPNSRVDEKVIEIIKKNISNRYEEMPFKELKMSFFGGEPLTNFEAVKEMLIFCKCFTEEKKIQLLVDFTTNATLLTEDKILFLKDFTCMFQITLDGNEKKHNKIRCLKINKEGTYRMILENIHNIQKNIEKSSIWVRVNYDNLTLEHFDQILHDISDLDRKKTFLIIRKVWQLPVDKIDKSLVINALQMAIDAGFMIDNYSLPRTQLCFADRVNQVLFNYDGKVFKCSTLTNFDESHTEGVVDDRTGKVKWNLNKIAQKVTRTSPQKCLTCKIYPVCLGPCGRKLAISSERTCMVDQTGLTMDEFIMYYFKLNGLYKKLFEVN